MTELKMISAFYAKFGQREREKFGDAYEIKRITYSLYFGRGKLNY